jgi:hypothetical protein
LAAKIKTLLHMGLKRKDGRREGEEGGGEWMEEGGVGKDCS